MRGRSNPRLIRPWAPSTTQAHYAEYYDDEYYDVGEYEYEEEECVDPECEPENSEETYFTSEMNKTKVGHIAQVKGKRFYIIRFIADTGATSHMTKEKTGLINIKKLEIPRRITCANKDTNSDIIINHCGTLPVLCAFRNKIGKLCDLLYSEKLAQNLLSIRKLVAERMRVKIDEHGFTYFR